MCRPKNLFCFFLFIAIIYLVAPLAFACDENCSAKNYAEDQQPVMAETDPTLVECADLCAEVEPPDLEELIELACDPEHDCFASSKTSSFLIATGCGCTTHYCN